MKQILGNAILAPQRPKMTQIWLIFQKLTKKIDFFEKKSIIFDPPKNSKIDPKKLKKTTPKFLTGRHEFKNLLTPQVYRFIVQKVGHFLVMLRFLELLRTVALISKNSIRRE